MESVSLALRPRFSGAQQELAQDGSGPLGFLINLARFFRTSGEVFPEQEALRVAQNAGQGIAQFMRYAGDHLTERGEFFRLQQLGLKNALGSKVAVNLEAAETAAGLIQNRTHGTLEDAGHRPR